MEIDNTPQAKFMKNVLKKDHPEMTDEEIEKLWQDLRDKPSTNDDDCLACGS